MGGCLEEEGVHTCEEGGSLEGGAAHTCEEGGSLEGGGIHTCEEGGVFIPVRRVEAWRERVFISVRREGCSYL